MKAFRTGYVEDGAVEYIGMSAQHNERQEDKRREEGVQKQYGNDGISLQCLFLEGIIAA